MKIAMIGQKGMPATHGGVERHVHELSLRLVKLGQQVTVYSRPWYTQMTDGQIEGVEIKHLPSINTKHLDTITHSFLATLDAITKGFDIIHYQGVGPSLVSFLPRLLAPHIRVITTFHSMDRKHEKWNWFARLILKIAEWTACHFSHETIAVSRTIEQYCRDVYDRQAVYIPNGVPLYEKKEDTTALAPWGLEKDKYLLTVSRLIPVKGIQYLIKAFRQLPTDLRQKYKLVIVGDGYHTDEYVRKLKQLASGESQIVFTGWQAGETLAALYSQAHLLIHPSDIEGLPITVLEAMSYELPVLLSDIPEHRELENQSQYLFTHGQVDVLTKKLEKILRLDDAILKEHGAYNRAKIENHYSWSDIVQEMNKIYQAPILAPRAI
ncbi:MAG TPA: glycosyltransferase family 4 protein [Patescibacteria group bacterium]|nr:glycosyltransferase family 4 protein [Patescibacteria group bacterium]